MANDNFNPYHQWLGLDRSVTRPDYYQLLGIAPNETNAQRIAAAADQATARVRSHRPGNQATAWARLLDEIAAAKACLTDPAKRAEYDRQLASPAAPTARPFSRPAPRQKSPAGQPGAGTPLAHPATASPAVPMSGPAATPATAAPQGSVPTAVPMSPQPGRSPQSPMPAASQADPMAPVMPAPQPYTTAAPQTAGVRPVTAIPVSPGQTTPLSGGSHLPTGIPVASVPTGGPVGGASGSPRVAAGRRKSASVMAKTRANRSSLTPLLAIVTACLILFVAVLLIVLLGGGLERDNRSRRPAVVQSRPIVSSPPAARNRPVRPTRPKPSPVVQPQPPRPSDVDSPEPKFDVAPVVEQPPDSPSGDPSLAPATDGNMVAPDPVETFAVKPAPGTGTSDVPGFPAAPDTAPTEPAFPTDQGSTPASVPDDTGFPIGSKTEPDPKVPFAAPTEAVQPTRDEVTALAAALKAARTALFDHDFDGAEAELAKVESLSKLPEHHEKYERLYLLTQYARNFREALSKAIQSLEAGDEIEVGTSTVVGVVNTAADRITIRLSGANRDYSLETLPPGLAVAIADKWLNQDDPVSLVVKGAYLATIQDVGEERLARAREWWQDASRRGVDIGELEKVIDDTYDLEKDLTP